MPVGPQTFGEPRSGRFDILRGYDHVDEVSYDIANVQTDKFDEGEWVVPNAAGAAVKASATSANNKVAYPVVTGKERSDVKGSDSLTVILGSKYHARTTKFALFDSAGTAVAGYAVGDPLCVQLRTIVGADGANFLAGVLVKALTGDTVLARALGPVSSFTDDSDQYTGLGSPESTLLIEVL